MLAPAPQAQVRHDYQRRVSTGSIALLSQFQCAQQKQPHLQYAHLPGASASYATMTRTETYTQPAAAKSIPPKSKVAYAPAKAVAIRAARTSPMQRKPSILGLGLGTSLGKSSGGGIGIGTGLPSALTIGRSATGGKASTASSVGGPAFVPHANPNNDVPQSTNPIRLSAESANRKSEEGEHELDSTTTVRPFEGELHRLARAAAAACAGRRRWWTRCVGRTGSAREERVKEKKEKKSEHESRRTSEASARNPAMCSPGCRAARLLRRAQWGFEFHHNRPAFYPRPSLATDAPHARQDSLFSIASVSSIHLPTNRQNLPRHEGAPALHPFQLIRPARRHPLRAQLVFCTEGGGADTIPPPRHAPTASLIPPLDVRNFVVDAVPKMRRCTAASSRAGDFSSPHREQPWGSLSLLIKSSRTLAQKRVATIRCNRG
ncbi:hypothetical protein B0H13DRAFT_2383030 [Mycena leptocephala]|nr:hypothetical protein B0H13DRAFT_2383030 [Mycena leptocephala]